MDTLAGWLDKAGTVRDKINDAVDYARDKKNELSEISNFQTDADSSGRAFHEAVAKRVAENAPEHTTVEPLGLSRVETRATEAPSTVIYNTQYITNEGPSLDLDAHYAHEQTEGSIRDDVSMVLALT
jgi:hypothetical protein